MSARPLIGISTYAESGVRWGVWRLGAALPPAGCPRPVQRAGGPAAMLSPDAPERAADAVARLDGPVIVGGPDVEPVRHGAEPDARTGPPARARDAWELALIKAALHRRVPPPGICRDMHLLNVALGGTLVQHIDGHARTPGVFGHHPVKPVPGTLHAGIVPEQTFVSAHPTSRWTARAPVRSPRRTRRTARWRRSNARRPRGPWASSGTRKRAPAHASCKP